MFTFFKRRTGSLYSPVFRCSVFLTFPKINLPVIHLLGVVHAVQCFYGGELKLAVELLSIQCATVFVLPLPGVLTVLCLPVCMPHDSY